MPTSKTTSLFNQRLIALLPELRVRALRFAKNPSDADDLVQDTVVRALRFEAQYSRDTNLRAWVYQIMFSVFISRYRRTTRDKKAMRSMGADVNAWTTPAPFAAPDKSLPLTKKTERCLSRLPAGYREALMMVDVDDQSYGDAAIKLGVPIGTVMSRLHRARRMMADALIEPKAA